MCDGVYGPWTKEILNTQKEIITEELIGAIDSANRRISDIAAKNRTKITR